MKSLTIINERLENKIILEKIYNNNKPINYFYLNEFSLDNVYNFLDNNNRTTNNSIYVLNNKSPDNNNLLERRISEDIYKNSSINISFQSKNFGINSTNPKIENETKQNLLDKKYLLDSKEKKKQVKIINKPNKKKNIFKVSNKISRYRGVSKNKKKWQVYIRINKKNTYFGSYSCEKIAAKIYDIMAIKKMVLKQKLIFNIITYKLKN